MARAVISCELPRRRPPQRHRQGQLQPRPLDQGSHELQRPPLPAAGRPQLAPSPPLDLVLLVPAHLDLDLEPGPPVALVRRTAPRSPHPPPGPPQVALCPAHLAPVHPALARPTVAPPARGPPRAHNPPPRHGRRSCLARRRCPLEGPARPHPRPPRPPQGPRPDPSRPRRHPPRRRRPPGRRRHARRQAHTHTRRRRGREPERQTPHRRRRLSRASSSLFLSPRPSFGHDRTDSNNALAPSCSQKNSGPTPGSSSSTSGTTALSLHDSLALQRRAAALDRARAERRALRAAAIGVPAAGKGKGVARGEELDPDDDGGMFGGILFVSLSLSFPSCASLLLLCSSPAPAAVPFPLSPSHSAPRLALLLSRALLSRTH